MGVCPPQLCHLKASLILRVEIGEWKQPGLLGTNWLAAPPSALSFSAARSRVSHCVITAGVTWKLTPAWHPLRARMLSHPASWESSPGQPRERLPISLKGALESLRLSFPIYQIRNITCPIYLSRVIGICF